jgi:hypothetical protein
MRDLLDNARPPRLFLAAVLITVGVWLGVARGQEKPGASSSSQTSVPAKGSKAPAAVDVKPLACGSSSVQAPDPATQHHKVILSWKASARAASPEYEAVGYCVYRSTKQSDDSPELINSTPFVGTGCTDDSVSDNRTYYYVVKAISAKGKKSPLSNEAPAPIPSEGAVTSPTATGSFPSCRAVPTP